MINGLTNTEAMPALERLLQFAEQRHSIIAQNVANFSTPGYRPADVSVEDFQARLAEAVDDRRRSGAVHGSDLRLEDSSQVDFRAGRMALHAEPSGENILFHNGNDRDVERTMQKLVENVFTFRTAAQLLKNQFELINTAIRERV